MGKKRQAARMTVWLFVGTAFLLVFFFFIYDYFQESLMKQEKDKIILLAETASGSLETYFEDKQRILDYYFDVGSLPLKAQSEKERHELLRTMAERFLERQEAYLTDLFYVTAKEAEQGGMDFIFQSQERKNLVMGRIMEQEKTKVAGWVLKDGGYKIYLLKPIITEDTAEGYMVAGIDLNVVYQEVLEPVQLGARGYCNLKDSSGFILMHPTAGEIGVDSVKGRIEKNPELDAAGIDRLVSNQLSGKSGCDIVNSYWWEEEEENKVQVKKMIAYTPAWIDGENFPVSLIVSYDELWEPVKRLVFYLMGAGTMILLLTGTAIFRIGRESKQMALLKTELEYERELRQAREELERHQEKTQQYDRLQTMGVLTGTIAHEFNNLMTPVMLYCDLLSDDRGRSDLDFKEDLEEIRTSAERCKELAGQLLSFGRQEREAYRSTCYDAVSAARSSLKMVRRLLPENIILVEEVENGPVFLFGNGGALNQIILNLCTNAFYAMKEEKKGTLTVRFFVEESAGVSYAVLVVSDTGCGIPKEELPHIYDTFYTTKPEGEGTGLGLSVVQRLTGKHGGKIQVESEPGKGTSFCLVFPVYSKPVEMLEEDHLNEWIRSPKSVILVDDRREVTRAMEKGLQNLGWEVKGYTWAPAAYEAMKQCEFQFDILLTDASMPELDGLELCRLVKSKNPVLMKIMMTGSTDQELEKALEEGIVDAVLTKPVSIADLIRTLYRTAQKDLPEGTVI